MQFMTKSEVRCASLLNNVLDENINVNEILEKIESFKQRNIRPGVGKIEFTMHIINFVHNKTIRFVNPSYGDETTMTNMFDVPEVESTMVKRILPKSSTPKKDLTKQDKKTVQIHTLTSKLEKTKINDTTMNERKCLDILGSLYAAVIKSNILCNVYHELGYVFTLLSVKNEETKSNNESFDSNINYFKSSNDCHYFASKTIQDLASILEYLERPIINLILKRKTINTFVPELTNILNCNLNSTNSNDDVKFSNSNSTKDMVKFDEDYDARDCFPTLKMFHAFKSQRDAFYDLLEKWKENDNQPLNNSASIIKLLDEHDSSINMSKFAKLFVAQLVNSSFEESKNVYKNKTINELSASKLELLHQRITKRDYTSGYKIDPANEFSGVQVFFKEFIILMLNNGIFCKHLIDILVHRIDVLNTMEWASELQEGATFQQTFFSYMDTLRLLAKFLAFIIYHPYKDCSFINPASREYLWEIRSKVLPPLNIHDKLVFALNQGHGEIVLAASWIIEFLYQVDQISISTPYYKTILTQLYYLCAVNPVTTGSVLMLRLQFNCLLEYFNITPHTLFYETTNYVDKSPSENAFKDIKNGPIVNTKLIYHYCPQLNNYRNILECKVNNKKIKFVSPKISSSNRKSIQNSLVELELESNFFENHSPSVLATVDFVAKRIASSCTKKIQNKGLAAVKNLFIDIVCEKFNDFSGDDQDFRFKLDESDVSKCSVFLTSTIQQYVDNYSKNNIPNSMKELLDFDTVHFGSLPFCIAVAVRKFKALVAEWVKNHINIKSIIINYINTELKTNLKNSKLNEDSCNLREILVPTQGEELEEELFIPENKLLVDLNKFSLKAIKIDDYELTADELFEYAEKFKFILEKKSKFNSTTYHFIVTRLIDTVFLTTYHSPKFINANVIAAYHPYLAEDLYPVSKILCERNIYLLSNMSNSHKTLVSEKITAWIKHFIENDFLTIDELTSQIMAILKFSWPEDTLKCLSISFKDLNSVCLKKFDDTKVQELFMWLTHFMDVIEDYDEEF